MPDPEYVPALLFDLDGVEYVHTFDTWDDAQDVELDCLQAYLEGTDSKVSRVWWALKQHVVMPYIEGLSWA